MMDIEDLRAETYAVEIIGQDVEEVYVAFQRLGVEILQVLILGWKDEGKST